MRNEVFQNANQVFKGKLCRIKKDGKDKSEPRSDIEQSDLQKLFDEYFIPGLANGNTEILLHKVFFDIMFYTGRRGKEGLRNLQKDSFEIKKSADGREYLEITFNEVTKKNQGDQTSSTADTLHNNHAIITEMEGSLRCPVNSYKHYIENLHPECDAFFQYPNDKKNGFERRPIGKNSLAGLMSTISKQAKLSKRYTNHCIRKTTATGMKKQGFDLREIANVTKHKNIQSLENYIAGPTHAEKENYSEALFNYTHNDKPQKRKSAEKDEEVHQKKSKNQQEMAPFKPNSDDMNCINSTQNLVQNQVRQTANMFQSAQFNNCTITFQMPK